MADRRNFLLAASTTLTGATLAGCTGKGGTLDSSDTFGFEEIGGANPIHSVVVTATRYCELTYQGEVRKTEEGFENAGEVDILVVSEPVFREIYLSGSESGSGFIGLNSNFLSNPPSNKIEAPSQFDINGEFEGSGQMPAGNYRLLVVNQGERSIEFDLDTKTYEYHRDSESVSCDQDTSPLDVKYMSVTGRYPHVLLYHIDVNDESGSSYSLSLDLQSARQEISVSQTQMQDVCGVSFVYFKEIDLEPDVGDELRANIVVNKNGEEYAKRNLIFDASERTDNL